MGVGVTDGVGVGVTDGVGVGVTNGVGVGVTDGVGVGVGAVFTVKLTTLETLDLLPAASVTVAVKA